MRRAEGGSNIFGVLRVKNHDFTPKKSYFFQLRMETRKFLGYFVWKITILRQKSYYFQFQGRGACAGCAPPHWIRPCVLLLMYCKFYYIPHHPLFIYRYMYKYHSGKSCDYGQAGSFKCFDHLEKLLFWMFHKISSANKDKILWIRKNNYIIFWLECLLL